MKNIYIYIISRCPTFPTHQFSNYDNESKLNACSFRWLEISNFCRPLRRHHGRRQQKQKIPCRPWGYMIFTRPVLNYYTKKTKICRILTVKSLLFIHIQNSRDGTVYFFRIHFGPSSFILYDLILIESQLVQFLS